MDKKSIFIEKKWNIWLIIAGVILIILLGKLSFSFSQGVIPSAAAVIVFLSFFIISFGIVNYTNWNIWLKIVLSVVLGIVIITLLILLFIYSLSKSGPLFPFM